VWFKFWNILNFLFQFHFRFSFLKWLSFMLHFSVSVPVSSTTLIRLIQYNVTKYGTRYGGTVTVHPVHCNPTIENVSKLYSSRFLFSRFCFFEFCILPFSLHFRSGGFFSFVWVNRFIIFLLTDISVSVSINGNHTDVYFLLVVLSLAVVTIATECLEKTSLKWPVKHRVGR